MSTLFLGVKDWGDSFDLVLKFAEDAAVELSSAIFWGLPKLECYFV